MIEKNSSKTYTLHTAAPIEIVRNMAASIAMQGYFVLVNEAEDARARRLWTTGRWIALLVVLVAAPLSINYFNTTSLQSFYLGWVSAVAVLFLNRGPK